MEIISIIIVEVEIWVVEGVLAKDEEVFPAKTTEITTMVEEMVTFEEKGNLKYYQNYCAKRLSFLFETQFLTFNNCA